LREFILKAKEAEELFTPSGVYLYDLLPRRRTTNLKLKRLKSRLLLEGEGRQGGLKLNANLVAKRVAEIENVAKREGIHLPPNAFYRSPGGRQYGELQNTRHKLWRFDEAIDG
jgi:hypothetical protein